MKLLPDSNLFPSGREHYKDWAGLNAGSMAAVLAELARSQDHLLVVLAPNSSRAQQLTDSLSFYLAGSDTPVMLFPDWETLPYDLFSPHQDIISDRIQVLHQLPTTHKGILVVPVNTLMQRLAPPIHITGNSFLLKVGDRFDMEATRSRLVASGYRQRDNVYEHGEFAVRGAIMDIFPMGAEQPFRIELFDDEIESLRLFEAESQRSTGKVDDITLLPAAEFPLSTEGIARFRSHFRDTFDVDTRHVPLYQDVTDGLAAPGLEYYLPLFFEQMATLFDYLPDDVRLVELADTQSAIEHFWQDVEQRHESRRHDIHRPILAPWQLFLRPDELNAALKQHPRARQIHNDSSGADQAIHFDVAPMPALTADVRANNPLALLHTFSDAHPDTHILICAETAGRREALLELMQKIQIQPAMKDNWPDFIANSARWNLTRGELDAGFYAPEHALLVVTENDLYGERVLQRRRRKSSSDDGAAEQAFRSLGEMTVGSPVVHLEHGVGRYLGLTHMEVHRQQHEFLLLEYAGGDKLYVPVSSLHLISRYGGGDTAPLNRLGTEQWTKARQKAAEKIHDVAAELLNTYARREAREGRQFELDLNDYDRFSASFPFEETPDQQAAIASVVADMQSSQPMDRLVCGDVGFGKTEVAMRAAFVAVENQTQVAVLVPTTLLAQQHYESFTDRFADWPVNIEVLSRFRSAKEKTQVLQRLKEGKVDILVGTHQLLQETVSFDNLGLIIVDEEHRFGVRHKERLKQMRAECDILTLTATPIPRTLNMAMSGMRDISIIATPPQKRLSVKTFVQQHNDTVIKEALLRELLRGGQVYYLHNDIDTMEKTAADIRKLVPDARVGVAHGQMRERELEAVMSDFYHRRFNVLVSTTIIETGIDVPSANTIIIDRADKLGLAQLHQLRGRVGRSHHQAYAYLITPSPKVMTKDAIKRLEAIEQATDLGAGFMLASQDMEIRGAGELLGEEQHGNIETIGFSLYMEMLEQAVEALKRGEQPDVEKPLSGGPELNLRIPALIPEDYLPDVFGRLTLYKRIAGCKTRGGLKELQVEMIDRFGLLPEPVKNLFAVTELRQQADRLGIIRLDAHATGGKLEFGERTPVDPLTIVKLVQSGPNRFKLEGANALRFVEDSETPEERIQVVQELLKRLAAQSIKADAPA